MNTNTHIKASEISDIIARQLYESFKQDNVTIIECKTQANRIIGFNDSDIMTKRDFVVSKDSMTTVLLTLTDIFEATIAEINSTDDEIKGNDNPDEIIAE